MARLRWSACHCCRWTTIDLLIVPEPKTAAYVSPLSFDPPGAGCVVPALTPASLVNAGNIVWTMVV